MRTQTKVVSVVDKVLYIEMQRWRCKLEYKLKLKWRLRESVRRRKEKQRVWVVESRVTDKVGACGKTGITARDTGSERRIRGGRESQEWKRWLRQSRGEQKREFISSEGKEEVSCSAFTSQAHLNVKMRRGDTITIKARKTERSEIKITEKECIHVVWPIWAFKCQGLGQKL